MMADSPEICKTWLQRCLRYSLVTSASRIKHQCASARRRPKIGGWLVSYRTLALVAELVELLWAIRIGLCQRTCPSIALSQPRQIPQPCEPVRQLAALCINYKWSPEPSRSHAIAVHPTNNKGLAAIKNRKSTDAPTSLNE